jgi:hypothetical protein
MAENRELADKLSLIADYLEIQDENPFRIRAYRNAADAIMAHPESVGNLPEKRLTEIPGVGKDKYITAQRPSKDSPGGTFGPEKSTGAGAEKGLSLLPGTRRRQF